MQSPTAGRWSCSTSRSASRSPTSRRRPPSSTSTSSRRTSRGLQAYCDEHGLALWPHTKTHKSPEIGLRQLELGAGGLTVAKTGEAQVFRDAGAPRILVHYPPFGQAKWERLAEVAGDVELTVAVDSLYPAEGLVGRAAAPRRQGRRARRDGRRPAPHGPDERRGRRRAGAGALAAAGAPARRDQLLPGPLPRRLPLRPVRRERGARGGARRVRRRGPADRPHLGRLDAVALHDARDLRQRAARRHVRAARPRGRRAPTTRTARSRSRSPSSPTRCPTRS